MDWQVNNLIVARLEAQANGGVEIPDCPHPVVIELTIMITASWVISFCDEDRSVLGILPEPSPWIDVTVMRKERFEMPLVETVRYGKTNFGLGKILVE
ncbi:hypothetical protein AB4Z23_27540 [Agrobacterium sp. MCAB5]